MPVSICEWILSHSYLGIACHMSRSLCLWPASHDCWWGQFDPRTHSRNLYHRLAHPALRDTLVWECVSWHGISWWFLRKPSSPLCSWSPFLSCTVMISFYFHEYLPEPIPMGSQGGVLFSPAFVLKASNCVVLSTWALSLSPATSLTLTLWWARPGLFKSAANSGPTALRLLHCQGRAEDGTKYLKTIYPPIFESALCSHWDVPQAASFRHAWHDVSSHTDLVPVGITVTQRPSLENPLFFYFHLYITFYISYSTRPSPLP